MLNIIIKKTMDPKEFMNIINTNCGLNSTYSTLLPTSRTYLVSIAIKVILKTMNHVYV